VIRQVHSFIYIDYYHKIKIADQSNLLLARRPSKMASWFGNFKASEALGKLSEISSAVQQVSSKVQQSLPIDEELLKKLTLRSDELVAEHDLIDSEERRKEAVRYSLSNLLPWETKDEAREILVEECRDAIQSMASRGSTFTGPFGLPDGVKIMFAEDSGMEEASEERRIEADKKLQKMGTLPPLLDEFDLDAHVGLIERLFKIDKDLVQSHSCLLNAGKTEKVFWKNYFFHCAFIRYEKGLSVEEIWAVGQPNYETGHDDIVADAKSQTQSTKNENNNNDEVSIELTFEADENDNHDVDVDVDVDEIESALNEGETTDVKVGASASKIGSSNKQSPLGSYELVDTSHVKTEGHDDGLDDLDAEIEKELAELDDI